MITEPAGSAAQSALAGISATVLAWTGITFHSILWSFFGVLGALVFLAPVMTDGRGGALRVFSIVFLSTMIGAGLAEVVYAMMVSMTMIPAKVATGAHLGVALLAGAGAKPLLIAGVNRLKRMVEGKQ